MKGFLRILSHLTWSWETMFLWGFTTMKLCLSIAHQKRMSLAQNAVIFIFKILTIWVINNLLSSALFKKLAKKLLATFHSCTDGVAGSLTVTWLILSLWAISYSLSRWKIPINSDLFAFLLLLLTTLIGGRIVKIIQFHPLLGMLVVGMVWRNWNPTPMAVAEAISTTWSVFFRLVPISIN